MPRFKPAKWQAAVKYRNIEHHLGFYDTREEAEAAERRFKEKHNIDNSPVAVANRAALTRKLMA